MAVLDFTEQPVIDRETASRLNPFIGYYSSRDTLLSVRDGLEFLSFAALSTSDGGSDLTAEGLASLLKAMSIATAFEIETERVSSLKIFETETQTEGGAL